MTSCWQMKAMSAPQLRDNSFIYFKILYLKTPLSNIALPQGCHENTLQDRNQNIHKMGQQSDSTVCCTTDCLSEGKLSISAKVFPTRIHNLLVMPVQSQVIYFHIHFANTI